MNPRHFVVLFMGLFLLGFPPALQGQFSTNFPGIPRGSIPGGQGRFELDSWWARADNGDGAEVTDGFGVRLAFGKSWRIGSSFELGFDFTLGQAGLVRLPESQVGTGEERNTFTAAAGYAPQIGLKWRPFSMVDPDGYGLQASIGVGYRPEMTAVATFWRRDSTYIGGLAGDDPLAGAGEIPSGTLIMLAASYRQRDFEIDAAILNESAGAIPAEGSLIPVYETTSLRAGGKYRLTPGFALGAAFWSGGSPPGRDRIPLGLDDNSKPRIGLMLSFGRFVGKWTDLLVYSPTGNFSDGVALHLSVR